MATLTDLTIRITVDDGGSISEIYFPGGNGWNGKKLSCFTADELGAAETVIAALAALPDSDPEYPAPRNILKMIRREKTMRCKRAAAATVNTKHITGREPGSVRKLPAGPVTFVPETMEITQ